MMINIKKKVEKLKDKRILNNITAADKEKINDVINKGYLDRNNEDKNNNEFERLEYIKNIENKKELKNQINKEFNLLFNSCDKKSDTVIVEQIKEILDLVSDNSVLNVKRSAF